MPPRHIQQRRAVFSSSNVRDALASALTEIKDQDDLTDRDLGAILGKSKERAREYRLGLSTMDAETFGRGKQYWNGRFTGPFDRLCEDSRPQGQSDRVTVTTLLEAVTALSAALEDDDAVSPEEVRLIRAELENGRDAIEHHLAKLRPGEAA